MTPLNTIIDDTSYAATGLAVFVTNPVNGDQVTIAGKTYTFQSVLTNADGNVQIGLNMIDTRDNLVAAINNTQGSSISEQTVPQAGTSNAAPSTAWTDEQGYTQKTQFNADNPYPPQPGVYKYGYASAMTTNANVTAVKGPNWGADVSSQTAGQNAPSIAITAKTKGTSGNALAVSFKSPTNTGAITFPSGANLSGGSAGITQNGEQNIISWYGGYCNIDVSGTFGGASVQLQCCTKIPPHGQQPAAGDWIPLGQALTQAGQYSSFLNACLLSANVSGASGTTNLRVQVQPRW